ncbi:hypothetical protein NP233_g8912 [Leucocoprinus birnbaumii]|uniref:Uncharacterized protein n=1 Tax=Leucocoprinus birnbaumii TaxID=56174 RepID=A0AAD5VNW0_9AGAR|nr:hypothetical protein NP233_g8912 [Leucocoprinus birnbaumii]
MFSTVDPCPVSIAPLSEGKDDANENEEGVSRHLTKVDTEVPTLDSRHYIFNRTTAAATRQQISPASTFSGFVTTCSVPHQKSKPTLALMLTLNPSLTIRN